MKIRQDHERFINEYSAKARVQRFVDEAEQLQLTETRDRELQWIKELLRCAGDARQAIDSQDLDHFAQAFERVLRRAFALRISGFEKELRAELEELQDRPSRGGLAKAAQSPKHEAKIRVYYRWEDYHSGKKMTYTSSNFGLDVKYKNKADFAPSNAL